MWDEYERKQKEMWEKNIYHNEIVAKYKKDLPTNLTPIWDMSLCSCQHNDIKKSIVDSGVSVYQAKFIDVWNGVFKPDIYSKDTLWDDCHNDWKIAQVIESWDQKKKLSPIFLAKHGSLDLAVVADGKHRLTVSHYCLSQCNYELFPFMVETANNEWVKLAIPTAKEI